MGGLVDFLCYWGLFIYQETSKAVIFEFDPEPEQIFYLVKHSMHRNPSLPFWPRWSNVESVADKDALWKLFKSLWKNNTHTISNQKYPLWKVKKSFLVFYWVVIATSKKLIQYSMWPTHLNSCEKMNTNRALFTFGCTQHFSI